MYKTVDVIFTYSHFVFSMHSGAFLQFILLLTSVAARTRAVTLELMETSALLLSTLNRASFLVMVSRQHHRLMQTQANLPNIAYLYNTTAQRSHAGTPNQARRLTREYLYFV